MVNLLILISCWFPLAFVIYTGLTRFTWIPGVVQLAVAGSIPFSMWMLARMWRDGAMNSRMMRVLWYFTQASSWVIIQMAYWSLVFSTGGVDLMAVAWGLAIAAMSLAIALP
jgi:hypothetical protein